jgi:hypothetical protein
MAQFVKHKRCPECASVGKDLAGDNLAVYNDGSTYCFSCGYSEGSGKFVPVTRNKISLPFLTNDFPPANLAYLRQYLTDEEIVRWFKFSPGMNRHVFAWQEGDDLFYEARSVIEGKPKSLQYGDKPFPILRNHDDTTNTLVLVEDIISAIVCSRKYSAVPLFGSALRTEWLSKIAISGFDKVIVWLDKDKTSVATAMARKISVVKPARVVQTPLDPKEMGDSLEDVCEMPVLVW